MKYLLVYVKNGEPTSVSSFEEFKDAYNKMYSQVDNVMFLAFASNPRRMANSTVKDTYAWINTTDGNGNNREEHRWKIFKQYI